MDEDKYERFKNKGWKSTKVPEKLNNDGTRETGPQRSWRQIRETIFPTLSSGAVDGRYVDDFTMMGSPTKVLEKSTFGGGPSSSNDQLPQNEYPHMQSHEASSVRHSLFPSVHSGEIASAKPQSGAPHTDSAYESMRTEENGERTVASELALLQDIEELSPSKGTKDDEKELEDEGQALEGDFDDSATICTTALPLPDELIDAFNSELFENILSDIRQFNPTIDSLTSIGDILSPLLRSFALRMGHPGSSSTERKVMKFVYMNRDNVAGRFNNDKEEIDDDEDRPHEQDETTVKIYIPRWLKDVPLEGDFPTDLPDLNEGDDIEEQPSLLVTNGYREAAFDSVAYRWLISDLGKAMMLTLVGEEDVCANMQRRISECLEGSRIVSSRDPSKRYTMVFIMDWNPTAFFHQEFRDDMDIARLLSETITLIGSATDAQALPCGEYLSQVWPTSGPALLKILKVALRSMKAVSGELEDKTSITCHFSHSKLEVKVEGISDSIATVGEQLGWLGAALRPSCSPSGLVTCQPAIQILEPVNGPARCVINYTMVPISSEAQDLEPGQCWHAIFRNPVIVTGYPIPRRARYNSGLEMPLSMMAGLTMSPRIHKYNGCYFLKGYATALAPTEKLDDQIMWHLYYSADGSRLPYPELDAGSYAEINLQDLKGGRHIIGWCSEARLLAGSAGMNYIIKTSQLDSPGREFALEKVSFSVGQFVTGGFQFAIGRKDCHVRITHGSYVAKLKWLDQKYVTLWDVEDERGWLINGTAALLHLLRSSLEYSKIDKFRSEFLFEADRFQESTNPESSGSVLDVLLNQHNQKMELYTKEECSYEERRLLPNGQVQVEPKTVVSRTTIKDRTEELYETLEKLFDHNATSEASYKGINAKPRVQNHLEGWDFMEIATDRDPLCLKKAKLPLSLLKWTDFTRAIPAITLFGKGFGDLIRPRDSHSSRICTQWDTVSKHKNLLCVGIADLREIIDQLGDEATTPITVAPGIVWTNPSTSSPFNSCCPCVLKTVLSLKVKDSDHNAIQNLVSNNFHKLRPSSAVDMRSHPNGAVIFGPLMDFKISLSSLALGGSSDSQSVSSAVLSNSGTSQGLDGGNSSLLSRSATSSYETELQDLSTHGGRSLDQVAAETGPTQSNSLQVPTVTDQVSKPGSRGKFKRLFSFSKGNENDQSVGCKRKR